MSEIIKNRSEVLFIYDVKDANPNGDPLDENKPRIDEETGVNIVTDVRLKRTIRDYLYEYKGVEVFIREVRKEDGTLKTKAERIEDFGNIVRECIDIRLFGCTTAVKDKTIALTGPVQFKFGRSLHKVDLTYVKGTTVMPSGERREQGTFTERYILPYSLIVFYGIVNENAVVMQNIPLTDDDVDLMLEAMWYGTKNLISGSKFGQTPRFLLQIIYKEKQNFYVGELDKLISIQSEKPDEAIRDISEVKVDITQLVNTLAKCSGKIEKLRYKVDDRVVLVKEGGIISISSAFTNLTLQEFLF